MMKSAAHARRVTGLMLGLVLLAAPLLVSCNGTTSSVVTPTGVVANYLVPAGTAGRIARGEFVDVMPTLLYVRVGDVIVIDNQDTFVHTIGPFTLRPGEQLRHMWTAPGTIVGRCSTHLSDRVKIVVE
ncbi:MAG: hypothetical protein RL574_1389 [Actinomycetota bacterium]|jgi:hypothetical protein